MKINDKLLTPYQTSATASSTYIGEVNKNYVWKYGKIVFVEIVAKTKTAVPNAGILFELPYRPTVSMDIPCGFGDSRFQTNYSGWASFTTSSPNIIANYETQYGVPTNKWVFIHCFYITND